MRSGLYQGVAVVATAGSALADQVSLAPDKDNTLYQDATGALSNGMGESIFSGETASGGLRRALLHFNVAGAVPAGATITNVKLRLNLSQTIANDEPMTLYRSLKDWGEGTSVAGTGTIGGGNGAAATPGDATWLHTFWNTQFWGTPGGSPTGVSPDLSATASATTVVGSASGPYSWESTPALVADVQGWLDHPGTNDGWFLIGNETAAATAKKFDSRESQTVENRPQLDITYTPAGSRCYANCDGSTAVPFLNIGDFVCFQSAFAAGSSYANCDGSTAAPVLNISDFVCFQTAFAAGCSAP
jgi:hypothetical protein